MLNDIERRAAEMRQAATENRRPSQAYEVLRTQRYEKRRPKLQEADRIFEQLAGIMTDLLRSSVIAPHSHRILKDSAIFDEPSDNGLERSRTVRIQWGNKFEPTEEDRAILKKHYLRPSFFERIVGGIEVPDQILLHDYYQIQGEIILTEAHKDTSFPGTIYVYVYNMRNPHPYEKWVSKGVDSSFFVADPSILVDPLAECLNNPTHHIAVRFKGTDYWHDAKLVKILQEIAQSSESTTPTNWPDITAGV